MKTLEGVRSLLRIARSEDSRVSTSGALAPLGVWGEGEAGLDRSPVFRAPGEERTPMNGAASILRSGLSMWLHSLTPRLSAHPPLLLSSLKPQL